MVELGAGYGAFINNVNARRRIAVDAWPAFVRYVVPEVEAHVSRVEDLSFLTPASVDFVFASNLFGHLTQEAFASVLSELDRILAAGGTLNILQPNFHLRVPQLS